MAQNTENTQETDVGADETRATSTFRLNTSLKSGFKSKCKSMRLSQSAVIEACVEAFLSGRIIIQDGQAVSQPKVA